MGRKPEVLQAYSLTLGLLLFFFLIGSSVDPQLHENSVEADFSPLPQTKPIRGVNLGVVLDLGMRRVFTGCVLGGTTWLFLQMDQFL